MLFDLRGRGRRRTVQVIYLSLALLMGGGLVFFGIGGNTSGGLFDAFQGNSGSVSVDETLKKRLETFEKRAQANPRDAAAWQNLARIRYQMASTGGQAADGTFTEAGITELRRAEVAWDRYLALDPAKPDPSLANLMSGAFGLGGLREYDKAVQAKEIYIESRDPSASQYAQLAILAHAANQERKSTLAAEKAIELTPKDQRKDLQTQIDLAKTQIDQQNNAQQPESG